MSELHAPLYFSYIQYSKFCQEEYVPVVMEETSRIPNFQVIYLPVLRLFIFNTKYQVQEQQTNLDYQDEFNILWMNHRLNSEYVVRRL